MPSSSAAGRSGIGSRRMPSSSGAGITICWLTTGRGVGFGVADGGGNIAGRGVGFGVAADGGGNIAGRGAAGRDGVIPKPGDNPQSGQAYGPRSKIGAPQTGPGHPPGPHPAWQCSGLGDHKIIKATVTKIPNPGDDRITCLPLLSKSHSGDRLPYIAIAHFEKKASWPRRIRCISRIRCIRKMSHSTASIMTDTPTGCRFHKPRGTCRHDLADLVFRCEGIVFVSVRAWRVACCREIAWKLAS